MEGDPPRFPSGSTCPMVLGYPPHSTHHGFCVQGCHLLWQTVPGPFAIRVHETNLQHEVPGRPHNLPAATRVGLTPLGFGLLPVRSPLLGQSRLISFPAGTEMFQFPALDLRHLCIGWRIPPYNWRGVSPFRDLRINACLRLPEAYRSLPRLSSPVETEASTVSSS